MAQNVDWVVIKFGGTSVSTLSNWRNIASILRARIDEGLRPVLVCSALAKVSDALEGMLSGASSKGHKTVLAELQRKHAALAEDLGLNFEKLLGPSFDELSRLARGAALTGEVSPRLHARVMAFGELMSTKLGAAFLETQGLKSSWQDARECMVAQDNEWQGPRQKYLSASCTWEPDAELQGRFAAHDAAVIVTQGFIARNQEGDTVLLGRGGSDTSASYFAAKLKAKRCEIWTDVPGVYSANPREIPNARLLKRLDYEEAQEITSMGAKVLHPRCLAPCRDHGIPIHILCTTHPDLEGTIISPETPRTRAEVKAISSKYNITLISMESLGMWQQVGFLADVASCFKKRGISIDLVSTSQTNVTVSLDHTANALNPELLDLLQADLTKFCKVKRISPCASVSLVGRNIRAILHQLGPALAVFEDAKIHLVSQAANDLNFTFVVDEGEALRLADALHHLLFEGHGNDDLLGPTWSEVFENKIAV